MSLKHHRRKINAYRLYEPYQLRHIVIDSSVFVCTECGEYLAIGLDVDILDVAEFLHQHGQCAEDQCAKSFF